MNEFTMDLDAAGGAFGGSRSSLAGTAARTGSSSDDFGAMLSQAMLGRGGDEDAEQAAARFVSVALVEPVFKQMREPMFELPAGLAPGKHEKMFREFADSAIAERLTSSQGWPLVDAVVRQMRGAAGQIEQSNRAEPDGQTREVMR